MILAAALIAAAAVALALRIALARRAAPSLPPPLPFPPAVRVLLPVRDEEANVEACLRALLAQTTPVRIHVLDDGSTDRTVEIARSFAARDGRVELSIVPPPPEGVSGKVHALAFGSRDLDAPWILSVDADARPAPDALARALAAAEAERLEALSLAAVQRVETLGEALVTPPVFALLDLLLGDWRRAARGEGSAVANGQFFLLKATALDAIGGFEAILGETLDDVALAHRLRACGLRVGFWRAGDALRVRMYEGFGDSFRGWRRNLALILGPQPGLALALSTAILFPALLSAAFAAAANPAAALLAWAGGAAASAVSRDPRGGSPFYGCFYPADGLTLCACLLAAANDRRRGRIAAWRGRTVRPPGTPGQPSGPSGAR